MSPLNVKIIGRGHAAQKHRKAFEALPDLYHITDDTLDCDIVDICTQNHRHYFQVLLFMERKHVICEKPVCRSLKEIDNLISEQAKLGKQIFPIAQRRYTDFLPVGNTVFMQWQRDPEWFDTWYGDWEQAIGGSLTTFGWHLIDLYLQEHGKPMLVTAGMNTSLGPETYADIFLGEPGRMTRLVIRVAPDAQDDNFDPDPTVNGFKAQFTDIARNLAGEETPLLPTLSQARDVIEVLTAAYYSAFTGEPVTLPIAKDHPFYTGWTEAFVRRAGLAPISVERAKLSGHPDCNRA